MEFLIFSVVLVIVAGVFFLIGRTTCGICEINVQQDETNKVKNGYKFEVGDVVTFADEIDNPYNELFYLIVDITTTNKNNVYYKMKNCDKYGHCDTETFVSTRFPENYTKVCDIPLGCEGE